MQRRKLCVALRFDAFYEDKKMRTTHVVVKPYENKSVYDTLNSPNPSLMRGRGFPFSFFIVKFYYEYITIYLYRLL